MFFCGITSSIAIWSLNFWTWIEHFYQESCRFMAWKFQEIVEARLGLKKWLADFSALFEGRHPQRSKTYCSQFGWSNIYIYMMHIFEYAYLFMLVNLAKITVCKAGNGLTHCLAVLWNCAPSQELGWKVPHSSRYSRILSCLVILGLIFLESVTGGSFILVRKHFRMFIKEIWTRSLGHHWTSSLHLFPTSLPRHPNTCWEGMTGPLKIPYKRQWIWMSTGMSMEVCNWVITPI